jgi:tRNA pseudouridine55 synthase
MPEPFGFLVIDKPRGMTSHDVVTRVRRGTGIRRIGHAGTLDPMATGILVLCIGEATRLSEYVMNSHKVYEATILLGVETDTYDADGQIVVTADTSHLTPEVVEAALVHFQGEVQQIPPMYSALKHEGQRLYDLARQGEEIERQPRTVQLETVLLNMALPEVQLMIGCSPGTYIRSVAHDLGALLGVGGHLTSLCRMRSGSLREPIGWDTLTTAMQDGTWRRYLITEQIALADMPALYLDDEQADHVLHGRMIQCVEHNAAPLCRAYAAGRLIAILENEGEDRWHPAKVFHPDEQSS